MQWGFYPNFTKKEFDCKHTGENEMNPEFMEMLQSIRETFDKPMIISSGYRSPRHPIEATKAHPGEHTLGLAADVRIYGPEALRLIAVAYTHGIRRIGVQQKGPQQSRYIHIGMGDQLAGFPQALWSY